MINKNTMKLIKETVRDYTNEHIVYVVWFCKTLQNWKALASTTVPDGMYYELTYNGDKDEMYLDAYKKFENRCIRGEENGRG